MSGKLYINAIARGIQVKPLHLQILRKHVFIQLMNNLYKVP